MDILFLSVSAGGGHMKAAESLKSYVEETLPGSRTILLDSLRYINPIIDKVVVGGYLGTLKSTPKLYGKLYELTETDDNFSEVWQTMNRIISYKIKRLIRQFKPEIVVCTHPFTSQMVTGLKKSMPKMPKIATIMTDFAPHSFWLREGVDAYIVSHEGMKFEMINQGIPKKTIYPLGMPVGREFQNECNKKEVRKSLGLDENKTTLLIMGGSLGFGDIREVFLDLINSPRPIQLIVVTGQNKSLYKQIRKYCIGSHMTIKLFGYANNISELMSASDLLISKPGGMTISEALTKCLPTILISPIPGQEEKNSQFLLNSGIAARLYHKQNIEEVLFQVLDNPLRLKHMHEMCRYYARPNACKEIVELLKQL